MTASVWPVPAADEVMKFVNDGKFLLNEASHGDPEITSDGSNSPGAAVQTQKLSIPYNGNGVYVQFLGVGGMLFDDGVSSILIDPYFSRPAWDPVNGGMIPGGDKLISRYDVVEKYFELAKAQCPTQGYPKILFCTHGHFDHALDTGHVCKYIKEKTGNYPELHASRSVLNVCLSYLINDSVFRELAYHLECISYDFEKTLRLGWELGKYWRKELKGPYKHSFNEDEDKLDLHFQNEKDASYSKPKPLKFTHLCGVLRDKDKHADPELMDIQLQNLSVLFRVGSNFDEAGVFSINGKNIPEMLRPIRKKLDELYTKFNFKPIDGKHSENATTGDRPYKEDKIKEGIANTGKFKLHALKGFHINIPNFACRGTNPIPIPPPHYSSDMNTGELFNPIIEYDSDKNNLIMVQGSSNYHRGQMKEVVSTNPLVKNGISKLIIGAPGISMSGGCWAGPPNRPDLDGRKEFYLETVGVLKPKMVLFHHWDDFKRKLDEVGDILWFMSTHTTVEKFEKNFKKDDPDYKVAVKKWKEEASKINDKNRTEYEAWKKAGKKDEKPIPENIPLFNASSIRSFKFLPLFMRVKI
jgi:hypothetical protein